MLVDLSYPAIKSINTFEKIQVWSLESAAAPHKVFPLDISSLSSDDSVSLLSSSSVGPLIYFTIFRSIEIIL